MTMFEWAQVYLGILVLKLFDGFRCLVIEFLSILYGRERIHLIFQCIALRNRGTMT